MRTAARARDRLEDESMAMNATTVASGSSDAESDASATSHHDGYNVYFAFDMSVLTAKGQEIVTAAASATRADQTSRVALVGKADLSGTDPYNMALSQRRADTVRDALVAAVSRPTASTRDGLAIANRRFPPPPACATRRTAWSKSPSNSNEGPVRAAGGAIDRRRLCLHRRQRARAIWVVSEPIRGPVARLRSEPSPAGIRDRIIRQRRTAL